MADLYADIQQIYDYGATIVSPGRRVVASNFIDKVLFAHPDAPLLYWNGTGDAKKVPGLPVGEFYRGVNVFQGYIMVWRGNVLKWSSTNDYTEWVPVGSTATSFVFTLAAPFVRGESGVESTAYMYVNESPLGIVVGQYLRIDSDPNYDFFLIKTVLPVIEAEGAVSGKQTVAAGATKLLFLNSFVAYKEGAQLYFKDSSATLEVQSDAVDVTSFSIPVVEDFTVPDIGSTVTVRCTQVGGVPSGYVSVGRGTAPGQDIYHIEGVETISVTETVTSVSPLDNSDTSTSDITTKYTSLTLKRIGVGSVDAAAHVAGEYIVAQVSISVKNTSTVIAVGSFVTALKERWGFTVEPLDFTGASDATKVFPKDDTTVFTIDANGAGEVVNAGAAINGEILHFDTLSDYGYLFKHRSIQSVQYVGADQGTFYIRTEVSDEGLLGEYSFVKVGVDKMYLWGNKEIYSYAGGNQLVAIGQTHTKQLFAEVDKSKANQIIGYHNEKDQEIWFIYPVKAQAGYGPLRVFVYNYVEDSCTIDNYLTDLQAITAASRVEWAEDVIWSRAKGTWEAPTSWDMAATWDELGADVDESYTLIGAETEPLKTNGPAVLVHGAGTYNRLGVEYECIWETADLDGGDAMTWKYIDTVLVSLQVKAALTGAPTLELYVGTKKDYDDDIVWSEARALQVQGNGNYTTKVNIQRAGKYVRIRFRSNTADIQWRVSQVRVLGRSGGDM